MRLRLSSTSIRTRLFVAYVGIVLIGFALLTAVAGGQISSAARQDFERQLVNEVRLVAQVVNGYVNDADNTDSEALEALIEAYEAEVGGNLSFVNVSDRAFQGRPDYHSTPEIDTALRGSIAVVERPDDEGTSTFVTAAPVGDPRRTATIVQLSVPTSILQGLILQRWAVLGLIFALVAGVSVLATIWVSRSIIQPLYALRESALNLSRGDFSHRVANPEKDEIGQVAQAFNHMAEQVESMLEEQRAFASNTSHELRTPLTTIRLRSEALRHDDSLDDETAKRYVAEIDDEVVHLSTLIEDLTLLSRFDAGRAELGSNQIDLARFAASLNQQMSTAARAKNITLALDPPQQTLVVNASLSHLTVAFRNLLDNAIKYTPSGGKVEWFFSAGVDAAQVIIKDTGQGIEPEHSARLFERFYRADKARSRDVPGSGLGLALVKSIVEAYGGSVTVDSPGAGQGTTVTVSWPYQPAPKRRL
ncbi:MAG: HAMP domain-containing histidine kinase [Anaerolineae bacterium]|nr:HAMP domain-containing histidine kinase [Anaerolineae bacterium]